MPGALLHQVVQLQGCSQETETVGAYRKEAHLCEESHHVPFSRAIAKRANHASNEIWLLQKSGQAGAHNSEENDVVRQPQGLCYLPNSSNDVRGNVGVVRARPMSAKLLSVQSLRCDSFTNGSIPGERRVKPLLISVHCAGQARWSRWNLRSLLCKRFVMINQLTQVRRDREDAIAIAEHVGDDDAPETARLTLLGAIWCHHHLHRWHKVLDPSMSLCLILRSTCLHDGQDVVQVAVRFDADPRPRRTEAPTHRRKSLLLQSCRQGALLTTESQACLAVLPQAADGPGLLSHAEQVRRIVPQANPQRWMPHHQVVHDSLDNVAGECSWPMQSPAALGVPHHEPSRDFHHCLRCFLLDNFLFIAWRTLDKLEKGCEAGARFHLCELQLHSVLAAEGADELGDFQGVQRETCLFWMPNHKPSCPLKSDPLWCFPRSVTAIFGWLLFLRCLRTQQGNLV
mmetsp:Transcript_28577/g.62149  ORF Transcript_28577/g.62149 Transcript_28577/m.62149 type:complete len:456 (+) Transcript_28577:755-2122(+)